jgi:branched-chain amino acid transport system substrate-binding protein
MFRKASLFVTAVLLTGASLLSACTGRDDAGARRAANTIRIAAVAPITGSQGEVGQDLVNGIRLAVDEVNRTGGVLGRQVELVVLDDAADPKQAVAVAQRILADRSIVGIVGHMNSGTTKPASAVYGPAGIPVVMPVPTNPEITEQGYQNLFRIPPTDFQQGEAVAEYGVTRAGKKRFAIIHDKTDYGQPLAEVVRRRVEQLGGTVVAFEGVSEGDKDFRAVLTRIKQASPDAIFFGGIYNEMDRTVRSTSRSPAPRQPRVP